MITIDCRTCRHASRDGCHSTVQCVDADQYKPTPTHQFWVRRSLMELGGMLHTGAPAVPVDEMSISEQQAMHAAAIQVGSCPDGGQTILAVRVTADRLAVLEQAASELDAITLDLFGAHSAANHLAALVDELRKQLATLRATAERALHAWDTTVLQQSYDGAMQECMECLRADMVGPAERMAQVGLTPNTEGEHHAQR